MWRAPRKLRPASAGTRASASPPTAAPLSRGWAPGEKLPRQRPNQSAEMSRMWPHRGTAEPAEAPGVSSTASPRRPIRVPGTQVSGETAACRAENSSPGGL